MLESPAKEASDALRCLDEALERSLKELESTRQRVTQLLTERAAGKAWRDIVTAEQRPLVVETVSNVLDELSVSGSRFRRAEAQALYAEGLSMERVAALFGVTRQRVSALLRGRETSRTTS
jgi:hypothetical protein